MATPTTGTTLDAVANGNDGFFCRFTRLKGERFKADDGYTEVQPENAVIVQWQPSPSSRNDSGAYAQAFPLTREGLQLSVQALEKHKQTLKL